MAKKLNKSPRKNAYAFLLRFGQFQQKIVPFKKIYSRKGIKNDVNI